MTQLKAEEFKARIDKLVHDGYLNTAEAELGAMAAYMRRFANDARVQKQADNYAADRAMKVLFGPEV